MFVVSCGPSKECKPKTAPKMIAGEREADFFKIVENCQIFYETKIIAFFSKISYATLSFWGLITKIGRKSFSQCLIVGVANNHGSRVIVKNSPKSRYIGFCGP